jgi:hypothetical protein
MAAAIKTFVEIEFCVAFDPKLLVVVKNLTENAGEKGVTYYAYGDDHPYFVHYAVVNVFRIWKGHHDECCGMSCDYYECHKRLESPSWHGVPPKVGMTHPSSGRNLSYTISKDTTR